MTTVKNVYIMILYVFGFILLWEWIRPLSQLTDTGGTHYFIIFIILSLCLDFFNINRWIKNLVKILSIFILLNFLFSEANVIDWFYSFFLDFIYNIGVLVTGNFFELSDLFRTFLFFILLWIMTYLLQYWLVMSKKIFLFYLMTIVYVSVLDTFTKYNGEWAIVRVVLVGFVLLGTLFLNRLLEKEQIEYRHSQLLKWSLSLVGIIAVSMFIGFVSPKAGPIWPDPVPFFQSTADNVLPRKDNVSTIGYGSDDTRLGGPFLDDDQIVFEVKTPSKQYWRVETKDVYTGQGWIASRDSNPQGRMESGGTIAVDVASLSSGEINNALFNMEIPYPHIITPYGFFSVIGNEDGYFKFDISINKLLSFSHEDELVELNDYEVSFKETEYSLRELRSTNSLPDENHFSEVYTQYTQLPDSLPERVKDLSLELTSEYDNWFDKAKAIEDFFQLGEYTYEKEDVPVPEDGQDYVDQFLFETKRGYCDNFSTSMVTLLRAAGIPSRWAKGYAAGTYMGNEEENLRIYEVTNNEAHSWVEVFFPTEGWVPFEPTKGFDNYAVYMDDEGEEEVVPVSREMPVKQEEILENKLQEEEQELPQDTNKQQVMTVTKEIWILSFISILLVIFLGIRIYRKRNGWIPKMYIWLFKRKTGKNAFAKAYGILLNQLEQMGIKREAGQTLRDYAKTVDRYLQTKDMMLLTERYEKYIYREESIEDDWDEIRDLWENLIKRTTG